VYSFCENVLSDCSPLRASQNFLFVLWGGSTAPQHKKKILRSVAGAGGTVEPPHITKRKFCEASQALVRRLIDMAIDD
jgi:hypothetical protein